MTEDQAKSKWCPAYRTATSGGDPSSTYEMDNRPRDGIAPPPQDPSGPEAAWTPGPNINPWACCIGPACMAWRWAGYRAENGTWVRKSAEGSRWDPKLAEGFCGLAGVPQ